MDFDEHMQWWREARFGMIIHWGLYAVPAGEWQDQKMDYIGEWIQSRFRIPNAEYGQLAAQFNPTRFDADEWVRVAKRAGMKYIIITAKHHDGFAMYHSQSDPYNIVDATLFARDPLAELAVACQRHGIKLCVYYSQALDWHEPDAGGTHVENDNYGMSWGNDWDFPDHAAKDFTRYFEKKVKPQLRELLTRYGPLGIIWFDCPFTISRAQCQELAELVRKLQPDCITNNRLGNGLGDYGSLGDNMIPAGCLTGDWESIGTLNDTWGYKKDDHHWKSATEVLQVLTGLAGKGVNYALNIGPTAEGVFPEASVKVLDEIGHWMDLNAESIYATSPTPFAGDLPYGPVTQKPGKLFLHLQQWPGHRIVVNGLRNRVERAYLLADRDATLAFSQQYNTALAWHRLEIELPSEKPTAILPVLVLEIAGEVDVDRGLIPQGDGRIELTVNWAEIHREVSAAQGTTLVIMGHDGQKLTVNNQTYIASEGVVVNWFDPQTYLTWDFTVYTPERYMVRVVTSGLHHGNPWAGGHQIKVGIDGTEITATIKPDEEIRNPTTRCYAQAATECGEIVIGHAGIHKLTLSADEIQPNNHVGLALVSVQLIPVKRKDEKLSVAGTDAQ